MCSCVVSLLLTLIIIKGVTTSQEMLADVTLLTNVRSHCPDTKDR